MAKSNTNNTQQAAWIAIGGLFSFGFTIVSSMILSRYFDKADYGTYRQVLYVYHTMLSVFTLGLPKAFSYFLPRVEPQQAKSLISKITNIFFVLGGLFSISLYLGSPLIADLMNNQDLVNALKIFAIVPLLLLPTMGLEGILATFRKTKLMAAYTIITRLVMLVSVSLPVIIFNAGYEYALIGFVASSFFSFLLALYLKYYPVKDQKKESCNTSYKEIFSFSLPILYASLWGMLIQSADQFFVSRYFGKSIFAEFANGSTELPFVGMILGACSAVLSPIFSRMSHEHVDPQKEVLPLWLSVFEKTVKLTYPLILYCWFFADTIMVFLYGEKYEESNTYFRIKLITYIFTLIMYGPLMINSGRVKYYANVHMFTAIAVILLEYFSILLFNSAYAISITSMLCQLGKTTVLLWGVSKYFELRIDKLFPIPVMFKIIIPSALFLYLEHYFFQIYLSGIGVIWILIVSLCLYMTCFYIYSLIAHLDYYKITRPLIKK